MYFTIIDLSVLSVYDDKLRNADENADRQLPTYPVHSISDVRKRELV